MGWLKKLFGSNRQELPPNLPVAPQKTSINYLFPPQSIGELPTWRFVLHFKYPNGFSSAKLSSLAKELNALHYKVIKFPVELSSLEPDQDNETLGIPVEVPESRRQMAGALADYESDVWKVYGCVLGFGFGDLYYEAIDWRKDG